MKAVELVKEGNAETAFQITDKPDPVPEKNQVLIEVSHFGVNYADIMARNGLYNDAPPVPCVLGYEVVGRVEKTGSEAGEFKPGDRVLAFTLFGGYAQKAIADERTVVPLPEDVDAAKATALATQYCTAYYAAVRMANLQKGERVLIHACAGGVGQALLEICLWKGCEVAGTAGSDRKIQLIKERGAHHGINYRDLDFVTETRKVFGSDHPVDAAFDAVGGKTYKNTQKLIRYGGRHVLFGVADRTGKKDNLISKLKLLFDFGFTHPVKFLMKSQSLMGLNMLRIAEEKTEILGEIMRELITLHRKGIIDPYVYEVYPAQEIARAHSAAEQRKTMGKVALKWANKN